MNSLLDFAINMLNRNPRVARNKQTQEYIDILKNRDAARGQQVAENLCKTYGVSCEDAVSNAKKFFNLS